MNQLKPPSTGVNYRNVLFIRNKRLIVRLKLSEMLILIGDWWFSGMAHAKMSKH